MANLDAPHGLAALRRRGGGPLETLLFSKLASYGTAIFKNDVVHQKAGDATSGAVIEPWASATPGTTLASGIALNHGAASTLTTHLVYTDPDIIAECQDNNDTDGFTAANNNLNANIEANAGNATTLLSGHELDESTLATSSSRDVHTLGLWLGYNNDGIANAYGSNARVEVMFNQHRAGIPAAAV